MMTARQSERLDRLTVSFERALKPIFVFAVLNAVICWVAAWVFRETFAFSATLLGLGAFPIVVAVCAYLLVLVKRLERGG
jgi:hypothetical protein